MRMISLAKGDIGSLKQVAVGQSSNFTDRAGGVSGAKIVALRTGADAR